MTNIKKEIGDQIIYEHRCQYLSIFDKLHCVQKEYIETVFTMFKKGGSMLKSLHSMG